MTTQTEFDFDDESICDICYNQRPIDMMTNCCDENDVRVCECKISICRRCADNMTLKCPSCRIKFYKFTYSDKAKKKYYSDEAIQVVSHQPSLSNLRVVNNQPSLSNLRVVSHQPSLSNLRVGEDVLRRQNEWIYELITRNNTYPDIVEYLRIFENNELTRR